MKEKRIPLNSVLVLSKYARNDQECVTLSFTSVQVLLIVAVMEVDSET